MMCCRVFVLILLMLFTACATCAILFPQFRHTTTTPATSTDSSTKVTETVFFWYNESAISVSGTTYITRTYSRAQSCSRLKTYYLVQAALSVAGAGLGGLACLFTACWTSAGRRRCLGGLGALLAFLAFCCCGVAMALSACSYKETFCGAAASMEDADFKMVEGFGLIAAATGGFLITTVLELAAVCCACCC